MSMEKSNTYNIALREHLKAPAAQEESRVCLFDGYPVYEDPSLDECEFY